MGAVGRDITHILQVDDHAYSGQYGGNNDGDDPGPFHIDAGISGHTHILSDRSHILAEFCTPEPDDHKAEKRDDDKCHDRNLDAADIQRNKIIELLTHAQKTDCISHAVPSGQLDGRMPDRNDRSHQVQDNKLIYTVNEIADDVACDHLPASGHVQDRSAEPSQQNRDRNRDDHGEDHARNTDDLPV